MTVGEQGQRQLTERAEQKKLNTQKQNGDDIKRMRRAVQQHLW